MRTAERTRYAKRSSIKEGENYWEEYSGSAAEVEKKQKEKGIEEGLFTVSQ